MKRKITLGLLILITGAFIAACGSKKSGGGTPTSPTGQSGTNMLPSASAPADCNTNGASSGTCVSNKSGTFAISNQTAYQQDFLVLVGGVGGIGGTGGTGNVPVPAIYVPGQGWQFGQVAGALVQNIGFGCLLPMGIAALIKNWDDNAQVQAGCDLGWTNTTTTGDTVYAANTNGTNSYSANIQYVYSTAGNKQLLGAVISIYDGTNNGNGRTRQYQAYNGSTTRFIDTNKKTGVEVYNGSYVRLVSNNGELGRFY